MPVISVKVIKSPHISRHCYVCGEALFGETIRLFGSAFTGDMPHAVYVHRVCVHSKQALDMLSRADAASTREDPKVTYDYIGSLRWSDGWPPHWTCTRCAWEGDYIDTLPVTYWGVDWQNCPSCNSTAIPVRKDSTEGAALSVNDRVQYSAEDEEVTGVVEERVPGRAGFLCNVKWDGTEERSWMYEHCLVRVYSRKATK